MLRYAVSSVITSHIKPIGVMRMFSLSNAFQGVMCHCSILEKLQMLIAKLIVSLWW